MIKAKKGSCSECTKESYLTAGKCGYCYWRHRSKVNKLEKQKKGIEKHTNKIYNIPKFSAKRKVENALYLKKDVSLWSKTKHVKLSYLVVLI